MFKKRIWSLFAPLIVFSISMDARAQARGQLALPDGVCAARDPAHLRTGEIADRLANELQRGNLTLQGVGQG